VRLSPQDAAAKWSQRASAAQGDYQAGVQSVSQAPGAAAAAKSDKWLQGVQGAKDKFKSRVGAVSLSDWQTATVQKGAPRYGTGVQQAQGKMAQFLSEFGPHLDAVTARVKSMPDTTFEQRMQRMVEQAKGTSQFRRRGLSGGGG